jgi:hypothetical protein
VLACGTDGGATFRDAGSTPLGQCTTHVATNAQCPSRSDGLMNALEGLSLAANTPLTLRVTGNGSFSNQGWHYEIWGSSDGCTLDEKLGAFQLHNGPLDVRTCVSSKQAHAHLVLLYLFASTDGVSLSNWALSSCEGGCGG